MRLSERVYDTEPFALTIGSHHLRLVRVKDLEHWVDRDALLRDETEEPPYWAHLWTGALTLARYIAQRVECRGLDILDLGCGLGVTGIVASLRGGQVTFVDKEPPAIAFASRNARLNGCSLFEARTLDFTQDRLAKQFALILGAEILYDRPTFPALVAFLQHHLAPQGAVILSDARRTNTDDFYRQLDHTGLQWTREEIPEREDRLPLNVGIVTIRHPARETNVK